MDPTPEDLFIETLGLISQSEGLPPIAGRILGYLVLADGACSLTEIAEALHVSKASVSTNVRLLEMRGTAVREARRGSRQDHWRAQTRPHRAMLENLAVRFRRNAERIDDIADSFPPDRRTNRDKVAEFSEFYRQSATFLAAWADELDETLHRDKTGGSAPDDKDGHRT